MQEEKSGKMVATEQGSYYYHADHLGSSSVVTDVNGKFYEQIEYFPYGETWIHNKSVEDGYTTPYKFTSKEQDPETGLYYYGARYYDAKLSRWVSADDRFDGLFTTKGMDVYSYAHNNPVIYNDPTGHFIAGYADWMKDIDPDKISNEVSTVANSKIGEDDPTFKTVTVGGGGAFAPIIGTQVTASKQVGVMLKVNPGEITLKEHIAASAVSKSASFLWGSLGEGLVYDRMVASEVTKVAFTSFTPLAGNISKENTKPKYPSCGSAFSAGGFVSFKATHGKNIKNSKDAIKDIAGWGDTFTIGPPGLPSVTFSRSESGNTKSLDLGISPKPFMWQIGFFPEYTNVDE